MIQCYSTPAGCWQNVLTLEETKKTFYTLEYKKSVAIKNSFYIFNVEMGKLNVAVVCSSNMNRSMETHSVLTKKHFQTKSFGTGNQIKIPGRSAKEPNVYPFGKLIFYYLSKIVCLLKQNGYATNQLKVIFKNDKRNRS